MFHNRNPFVWSAVTDEADHVLVGSSTCHVSRVSTRGCTWRGMNDCQRTTLPRPGLVLVQGKICVMSWFLVENGFARVPQIHDHVRLEFSSFDIKVNQCSQYSVSCILSSLMVSRWQRYIIADMFPNFRWTDSVYCLNNVKIRTHWRLQYLVSSVSRQWTDWIVKWRNISEQGAVEHWGAAARNDVKWCLEMCNLSGASRRQPPAAIDGGPRACKYCR